MGFFSNKSNSDVCASCGDQSALSKYGSGPVIDSRVVVEDDIDINRRSGQTFYTVQGEAITADMAFKMGSWYFYWVDMKSMMNPVFVHLCSRKCAIQYSKTNNKILFLHVDSGGNPEDEPIKPHQQEIDQYRYDKNVKGNKWNVSDD